ncbi:6,7-dimethyl-8-ribityllumazine synthase [Pacificibacter marinus]|uniref:6,7-dimethyl-8-ribityllumazine synthase n=1 Tax=Pacificibacter marinus TaxID=658057 RepID=A0A1Y5SNQ9_9RHOB|nr:6,7-dimethyl-8-ribityllumazine synthase [Pacificibacter marinus]SEK60791.1 6,7-dimethyl-8-ribityllumazine synthase [Pacificibacter marinus]SLN41832.1 6,7-dimethyl-8-ribityllumazine synthase 1 [Pacificibacter marinus]
MIDTSPHILDLPSFDEPVKLLIVVAPYFKDISDGLLRGAQETLDVAGVTYDLVEMPSVGEVPTAIAIAERMSNFDGYVALGCLVRGETTLFDTASHDSSHALQMMGLSGLCIGNGILAVDTKSQAIARSEAKGDNKGSQAAAAALHLVALSRKWARPNKGVGFHTGAIRLAGKNTGPNIA